MSRDRRSMDRSILFFATALGLGLAAAGAGLLGWESRSMFGAAWGLAPMGALGLALSVWIRRWVLRRHPERVWPQEDERLAFIRYRSGNAALWATYGYMVLCVLLGTTTMLRGLDAVTFGIASILAMNLFYFVALFVYSRTC